MDNTKYNLIISVLSIFIMLFLGLSGLAFIPIGDHLSIDFLIVPAILGAVVINYKCSLLIGLAWGIISIISPNYLPEYYPIIAAVIPRITTTIFATWLFNSSVFRKFKNKIISLFICTGIFHIITEVITNHFFNIYEFYGYEFSYKVYLFQLIIKKTIPETIMLIILAFILSKNFNIILSNKNIMHTEQEDEICNIKIEEYITY